MLAKFLATSLISLKISKVPKVSQRLKNFKKSIGFTRPLAFTEREPISKKWLKENFPTHFLHLLLFLKGIMPMFKFFRKKSVLTSSFALVFAFFFVLAGFNNAHAYDLWGFKSDTVTSGSATLTVTDETISKTETSWRSVASKMTGGEAQS